MYQNFDEFETRPSGMEVELFNGISEANESFGLYEVKENGLNLIHGTELIVYRRSFNSNLPVVATWKEQDKWLEYTGFCTILFDELVSFEDIRGNIKYTTILKRVTFLGIVVGFQDRNGKFQKRYFQQEI